jgi:[protein-PII] uridylyltransferase
VIEVRAADGIGLLYRIARTLADFHLDIRHAKALTLGHEVIDTFYVVTDELEQVGTSEFAAEIKRALLHAVRDRAA